MSKRLLIAVLAMDLLAAPSAQAAVYFEGVVGDGIIEPVDTDTATIMSPPDTVQLRGTMHFRDSLSAGAEAGWRNDNGLHIRMGVAYDYLRAKLTHADVSGAIDGAPFTGRLSSATLGGLGIDFDNTVHLATANVYAAPVVMNFFQPYIGIGAGAAFMEHGSTEPVITATMGFAHNLTPSTYVGLRYRFAYVWGPTDDLGFKYQPINANLFSAVFGVTM